MSLSYIRDKSGFSSITTQKGFTLIGTIQKGAKLPLFVWSWFVLFPQHQELVALDLGDVPLLAFLGLVGAGHEFALHHDFLALGEVIFGNLSHFAPGHDIVPLGIRQKMLPLFQEFLGHLLILMM